MKILLILMMVCSFGAFADTVDQDCGKKQEDDSRKAGKDSGTQKDTQKQGAGVTADEKPEEQE